MPAFTRRSLLARTALTGAVLALGNYARAFRGARKTPKRGMNMLLWTAFVQADHFPILERLGKAGFDGAEIPLGQGDAAHYKTVRQTLDNVGLQSTCVTSLTPAVPPASSRGATNRAPHSSPPPLNGWATQCPANQAKALTLISFIVRTGSKLLPVSASSYVHMQNDAYDPFAPAQQRSILCCCASQTSN